MIDRFGIHLGPLYIHFYALIIILGILAATYLAMRRAKQYGQDSEHVLDMFTWVILAGVVGARLWHVFTPSPSLVEKGVTTLYYFTHPLEILMIWNGGLGIPGAVAGGALALFFYARAKKLSFATWIDILIPGVLLAQAIGRWGNFVNEELYGAPTNLPWGIYIDPEYRLPGFEQYSYYHPTFLYESLWNIAGVILLIWLSKRFADRLKKGDIFLVYLLVYPLGRFLMEFLRLDSSQVAGLNANQTVMGVLFLFAVVMLFLRHRPGQEEPEPAAIGSPDAAPEPTVKDTQEP
jgi:phosphatidylglycerol---prolipoprotein diacylglyceryl transferase